MHRAGQTGLLGYHHRRECEGMLESRGRKPLVLTLKHASEWIASATSSEQAREIALEH